MATKPLSVARQDFLNAICKIINQANLPAFVAVEVLEKVLAEVRKMAENELKRDTANYHKLVREETNNGND